MKHNRLAISAALAFAAFVTVSAAPAAQPPVARFDPAAATPLAPLTTDEAKQLQTLGASIRAALTEGRIDEAHRFAVEAAGLRAQRQGAAYWEARRAGVMAEDLGAMEALGRAAWPELASSFKLQGAMAKAHDDGEYAEGVRLARQQSAIRVNLLGRKNSYTAQAWNNLALFLTNQNELAEAESLYWDALPVLQARYGELSFDVAQVVHNIAWLTRIRGDVAESERLFSRALEARRLLVKGPAGAEKLAETLNGLASLYFDTDRVPRARELYTEARTILADADPRSSVIPKTINNIAECELAMGNTAEARQLVEQALKLRTSQLGLSHPDTLWSLTTLAEVKIAENDLFSADALLFQVLQERRQRLGSKNQLVADTLRRCADVAFLAGDTRAAIERAGSALDMMEQLRTDVSGDERARAAYSGRLGFSETGALLAHLQAASDAAPEQILRTIERTRSRELLDLLARTSGDAAQEAVNQAREAGDTQRADRIIALRETETRLILARDAADRDFANAEESDKPDAEEQRARAAAAFREAADRAADASAALLSLVREALPQAQSRPVERLTAGLAQSDLALVYSWSEHGIVLIRADSRGVRSGIIVSGKDAAKKVNESAEALHAALIDPGSNAAAMTQIASALLDALVPAGTREELRAAGRIIVVPDGPLNALPMEAILAADPALARIPIAYAPSLSVFLAAGENRVANVDRASRPIVIVGDPVFSDEAVQNQAAAPLTRPPLVAMNQSRIFDKNLQRLEGTAMEAGGIAATAAARGVPATLLLREQATVPAVTQAATGARILHLATHGLMGSRANPFGAGLALTRPQRPTEQDVGLLRLEDLVKHWRGRLRGTDLVVLSACKTQAGVRVGGSDFALPWGFFYAGAPSVVASLWLVDDEATSLLMTRFYENLLGSFKEVRTADGKTYSAGTPLGISAALRESQAWLRTLTKEQATTNLAAARASQKMTERGIAAGKKRDEIDTGVVTVADSPLPYAHPYFWAGFVVVGNPE
ncbi:MAG: CHAT domain-containing protein [Planctomycetes bacterium]|nr:CHAT domain-containing protein [Planctomycetota bacterium]